MGRKTRRFTFKDIPMNRLGLAMVQRFQNDKRKFFSFMFRWFAFIDLVHSNVIGDEFVKKSGSEGEPDMIHPYVVQLAASFPLTTKGKFDHFAFLAELRRKVASDDDPTA